MSPEFIANPYPAYAYLRENAPVVKTPYGFWLLARHEMELICDMLGIREARRECFMHGSQVSGRSVAASIFVSAHAWHACKAKWPSGQ